MLIIIIKDMKTLFKNARILKMTDENILIGNLLVKDDRIAYIGEDLPKDKDIDEVIDCRGNVIMPGFKNAHTHSAMSFLRSKTDDHTLQDWLFNVVLPREALLQPGDVYEMAKISYLEYLTSGVTACFDQYYSPFESAKAAEEMGMRIVLLGTYNKEFDSVQKLVDFYHSFNDKDGLVRYCLGVHAEYTLGEGELEKVVEACHILKAPFYTHICETEKEVNWEIFFDNLEAELNNTVNENFIGNKRNDYLKINFLVMKYYRSNIKQQGKSDILKYLRSYGIKSSTFR